MSLTIKKLFDLSGKSNLFVVGSIALATLVSTTFGSANALDLDEGTTSFTKSPLLVRTIASHSTANNPSIYQFTIEVPDNAGQALKSVTISPKENAEKINFDVSRSKILIGDSEVNQAQLSMNKNDITFVFDEPVEPGNTVTVSLNAKRNPRGGGVYLFGVTAFPEGENSPGLYLGSGRLHFSRN